MIVYKTPYRNVVITLRKETIIGLTFSGGADSVILLYCLVSNGYIPTKLIYAYEDRPGIENKTNAMYRTLEYIENKFNVDLKSRLIVHRQDGKEMARVAPFPFYEECDVIYTGTTQNPSIAFDGVHVPVRPPSGMVSRHHKYENPFGTFDKRATIYLYNLLGINDLLSLTRSCGTTLSTPCGQCFHCLERKWAIDEVAKLQQV